jgi:hypothetical protein
VGAFTVLSWSITHGRRRRQHAAPEFPDRPLGPLGFRGRATAQLQHAEACSLRREIASAPSPHKGDHNRDSWHEVSSHYPKSGRYCLIIAKGKHAYPNTWTKRSLDDCIRRWITDIHISLNHANKPNHHLLRYENLVSNSEKNINGFMPSTGRPLRGFNGWSTL